MDMDTDGKLKSELPDSIVKRQRISSSEGSENESEGPSSNVSPPKRGRRHDKTVYLSPESILYNPDLVKRRMSLRSQRLTFTPSVPIGKGSIQLMGSDYSSTPLIVPKVEIDLISPSEVTQFWNSMMITPEDLLEALPLPISASRTESSSNETQSFILENLEGIGNSKIVKDNKRTIKSELLENETSMKLTKYENNDPDPIVESTLQYNSQSSKNAIQKPKRNQRRGRKRKQTETTKERKTTKKSSKLLQVENNIEEDRETLEVENNIKEDTQTLEVENNIIMKDEQKLKLETKIKEDEIIPIPSNPDSTESTTIVNSNPQALVSSTSRAGTHMAQFNSISVPVTTTFIRSEEGFLTRVEKGYYKETVKMFQKMNELIITAGNTQVVLDNDDSIISSIESNDFAKIHFSVCRGYNVNRHFPSRRNKTLMHLAVASKNLFSVHQISYAKPNLDLFDENDETPLMLARRLGCIQIVRYLIAAGANAYTTNVKNMNVLHLAIVDGDYNSVGEIIDAHPEIVDSKTANEGVTPLMLAAKSNQTRIGVALIVTWFCNIKLLDDRGNSAIHWAAMSNNMTILRSLLQKSNHVDLNRKNQLGQTPFELAILYDNILCLQILAQHDAVTEKQDVIQFYEFGNLIEPHEGESERFHLLIKMKQYINHARKVSKPNATLSFDISHGQETKPISCVNTEDNALLPSDYFYTTKRAGVSRIHSWNNITEKLSVNPNNCACVEDTSTSLRYDYSGRIKFDNEFKSETTHVIGPIYECNNYCSCKYDECRNRVVQKGSKVELQIFRLIGGFGWGVRAISFIASGTFICEFIGELLNDKDMKLVDESFTTYFSFPKNRGYGISTKTRSNVSRFIAHSAKPNSVFVPIYHENYYHLRVPRIAIFSKEDILNGEKITVDYATSINLKQESMAT